MRHLLVAALVLASLALIVAGGFAKEGKKGISGAAEFKEHCSVCHPEGRNLINPAKTLHKKDLEENNITKPEDIMAKIRNPGPSMTQFNKTMVSDKEAKAIAEYILKTFK
jgi:cytochrome c6